MTTRPTWFRVQQGFTTLLVAFVVILNLGVASPATARPIVVLVGSAVGVTALVRVAKTRLVIAEDGLVFRDLYRGQRVPWHDIVAFETRTVRPFPPVQISPFTVLTIRRRSGRRDDAWGTALLRSARRDAVVAVLRHEASKHGVAWLVSSPLTPALGDARKHQ